MHQHLPGTQLLSATTVAEQARGAGAVMIGVPDDRVAMVCDELARDGAIRAGQTVIHLSGALSLDALASAERAGADVLSLHPLQSFPDVETGIARLPGSGMAVTARAPGAVALGEALALDVGAVPFALDDAVKPLYHAAAVFCSNYLVTVEATAERLFRLAGVDDPAPLFEPLARANADATFARGPGAALTGPAVRGDVGTIARNAAALAESAPEALGAYVELARLAAAIASDAGRLEPERRRAVDAELDRWSRRG